MVRLVTPNHPHVQCSLLAVNASLNIQRFSISDISFDSCSIIPRRWRG